LKRPEGLARDRADNLFVADAGAATIFRITSEGKAEPLVAGK
jgi:hypothetical protein